MIEPQTICEESKRIHENATSASAHSTRLLAWGCAAAILVATVAVTLWLLRVQPAGNASGYCRPDDGDRFCRVRRDRGLDSLPPAASHRGQADDAGRDAGLCLAGGKDLREPGRSAGPAVGFVLVGAVVRQLVVAVADLSAAVRHPVLSHGQAAFAALALARTLGLGLVVYFMVVSTLLPELNGPGEPSPWTVPNPIGVVSLVFSLPVWIALLLTVVVASVASLFVRFRRADPVERSQLKWLLYAGGVFLIVYAGAGFALNLSGNDLFEIALFLSILSLPVAIAVAILRYRLYDIDVVIRKTLVYTAMTALLALVYFGSVILLQRLVSA